MQAEYYPITGIEAAYIAQGVVDSATAYSANAPVAAPPAESAQWAISQASTPIFGNNVKQDEVFGVEVSSITLRLTGISEKMDAELRGKSSIAASGRIAGSGNTEPPLCALGLKINKAPGEYVYIWFLKGRFSGGNIVATTKQDNVTVNMREYTYTPLETEYQFTYTDEITGASKTTGLTWFKGDTTTDAFDGDDWFTEVQTPDTTSAPAALALSTIVPDADAAAIVISANIVLTFNNKIKTENVVLIDAAGDLVASTKSFDATGKILTINPTSNLAANTLHIVSVVGVVDIYGQALAATTSAFTTA